MSEEEFLKKLKILSIITIVVTVIIALIIFMVISDNPLGTIMLIILGVVTSLITYPIRKYFKNKGKSFKDKIKEDTKIGDDENNGN